jgi:hypothetical protein
VPAPELDDDELLDAYMMVFARVALEELLREAAEASDTAAERETTDEARVPGRGPNREDREL